MNKINNNFVEKISLRLITAILCLVSVAAFFYYLNNGLGLAYNDARSHLDIGRRVVEGLKPGLAQLGSVWLPLNHLLMVPLVWNDWAWHSGFAGAVWNMLSFVGTGVFIYKILELLKVGRLGRLFGVVVFAANLNVLYLQSTAMTEPLFLGTMAAGGYYLIAWARGEKIINLIKASVWIMLSTLVRYDGWFLLGLAALVVAGITWFKKGYRETEGLTILFLTMGAFGVFLWFAWNLIIFHDPLFFILGPYSAHAQQEILKEAGNLPTKGNWLLSAQTYFYSLFYNSVASTGILGLAAGFGLWLDRKIAPAVRVASLILIAPLIFNIIALWAGFSVVFIQGISGNTWFNVRYGVLLLPAFGVFLGYLVERLKDLRWVIIGLFSFVAFFAFANADAVSIDDARVGSSQKNVTEVAGYLNRLAKDRPGYILISAASHDAIIFSSGLPMKRFIHEGTGAYWESALTSPDRWARWLVMRTYDENDQTYKGVSQSEGFAKYNLVESYPFADVYELEEQYLNDLHY